MNNLHKNLCMAGINPDNTIPLLILNGREEEVVGKVVVLDPERFGSMRENLLWKITGCGKNGELYAERFSDGDVATLWRYDLVAEVKNPQIYSTSGF